MATELLQDLEGLSGSAHADHAFLQADIAHFEEVADIVKSNLRMISELTHDENAQDGFPERDDEYADLLGILNMQSSDLEEKGSTESHAKEKIVRKDGGANTSDSNLEMTADSSKTLLQTSKDLLEDITLIINNDQNFTNSHHLVTSEKEDLKRDRKEMPGLVLAAGKLDVALRLLDKESTTESTKTQFNAENPPKDVDSPGLKQGNLEQREAVPAKDVYFEQGLDDLLDGSTPEVLTTPQEYFLEDPKSLDSMPESLLVERSSAMFPGQLFHDLNGALKAAAKIRLANQAYDDQDVTVDGEGGDNHDGSSLDLCQLSYDENLTCSFFELLQLHNDDNSELTEHGQRGRPPRQKVTRQAVPCKIEPKVSQAGFQPGFLPPQLFSSPFQNIQPQLTSAVPSQLQPHLGQEIVRFPVVLHSKTSASGQLYLEVCPDITQIASSSQASALSSNSPAEGRSSPKGKSEKSCASSQIEVASEKTNLGASTDRSSHFLSDSSKVGQNNFSLEIDGPIRRQTSLSQVRNGSSRSDPYYREILETSGQAGGSRLEEHYGMRTVQENQISMSSHHFVPISSVTSTQNLMRAENVSGFGGNVQHGMPYILTGMQGSLYQNNQRVPVPTTLINYGTHNQPSQYIVPTNNHHYELGNSTSSTNTHSHYFGHGGSGEPVGNWTSEPNVNIAASSASHCLQNNPFRHTVTSAAVPYARTSSPGLPNIPVDPLSRRQRLLMALGSHGQRQVTNDSRSDVHSTTTPQNVLRLSALNNEDNSSMIQLSPPVELKTSQFVHQQPVKVPATAHVPSSGATAEGSVFHVKSAPSQSSTRSSKGPELPVPVERSKTRVEQWLKNNVMFRPDLDSGTFDPSDHSLVPEPSLPQPARLYFEGAGSELALSEQSYEVVGLFDGKRMMVVPQQPSSKQKPSKRTSALNHHGKGSPLAQIGQNRHSIISDASLITESSLSSGYTNNSKDKHTENNHDAFNDSQEKLAGRKPIGLNTVTTVSACAASNHEHPITRQTPQEELSMPTQSLSCYPVGQLNEKQQADVAIAEGMKFLEQTSFEKRLAGISSSTSSGHVLSELEQYLRGDIKSMGGDTSGNHHGSGFKPEGGASGSSKQSSFDTSKYITPSDIESLEKKKTQNGKSSIDNYLEHVKYISNESMQVEQKASPQSDGKQLMNISLSDISKVIGSQGEVSQQPSKLGSCLPHAQFENRQKAIKRRPADHSDEATYQVGQTVVAGGQNTGMGEQFVAFGGQEVVPGEQNIVLRDQHAVLGGQCAALDGQNVAVGKQSCTTGGQNTTMCGQDTVVCGQNATMCGQNTAVCGQNATVGQNNITYMMQNNKIPDMLVSVHGMTQLGQNISTNCLASRTQNFGDQHFMVFSEQGGIPQTVIGPPAARPGLFTKSGLPQFAKSQISSTALSGPTQSQPVYESQRFQAVPADPATSQTMLSGKMQSDFQLPDFSDSCYETEMLSSPSSMEILKESIPSSNKEFFNNADAAGNPLVPLSSVSCTQHLMQSSLNKMPPAVAFTQCPLLSSSTHSTIMSASHVSNTNFFKKPQTPGISSSSSAAVHRSGLPTYPSVGGDSDVSMSSDTSLPNSMTLHDVSMYPKIHQQQTSPQQHVEQNSMQFQQINPQQPVPKMLQSSQQQVQHQKQQQLLSQHLQMQQNQQQQLLLQQQNYQQMEQLQLQQIMANQQQKQNQQISSQDYYQMQKTQHEILNQQNLQFQTKQPMISQQHQEIQNNDRPSDENQQKLQHLCNQQQFDELLLQQRQTNQQEQFYLMQIQKQQQIQKQEQYAQQQIKQQEQHLQQQIQQQGQHLQKQIQQQGHFQQQIQKQEPNSQQQIQQPGQHLQQQIQQQGQNSQHQIHKQGHLQQQIQKQEQNAQQQIQKQGHLQQQKAKQHHQIQNQQNVHLQNQQQLHMQQSQMQPGETSQSHQLQNQQQMQQYQWLLNQQHYLQMQQLQQQQIQKQQQKQIENQQLQQQQRLYQQQLEQYPEHGPALNNTCIPQRAPGSQAGSSCSEPQPSRVRPGAKLVKRSMSQISDLVYSQQIASLSPASETTHDLRTSIADNDLAPVPQNCLQLTGSSIQSGHGKNNFNNMDKNSMSGGNQQAGLQKSGNQPFSNTAAENTEIAEQDQTLKSATEIQLQKYLKEGFPSLHSAEYCQEMFGISSFSSANIPSMTQDRPQQSVPNTGQGLDSGDGSSDQSNKVLPAERSREEADSDLSAFSLGSSEDLLSFQQDNDGETPLHLLSELPKEGISSLPSMPGFYEALNLQNKNQETALDIAVKNENLDAVKFLVSHGADVNIFCLSSQKGSGSKTGHRNETVQQTALHEAVELGNTEILKVLLSSQNVKVDARRPDSGLTPLMLALQLHRQSDRKEIISELLNHQASLNLHDTIQGKTPLMFAIQSRDVTLVERILQQVGAERARVLVSDRAKKEMTCLHFAAELRLESALKKRLLRCIIVAGGDPSAKNSEGETPRDWAKADINEVLQNLARLFNP